jgi:hypothetical protein
MSKANGKQDPRVHYGPPPETWLWDLCPLADNAWGNILGFNDGVGDGNIIDMRLWLRPTQMSNYPPPVYRPARAPLPPVGYSNGGVRRCYIPQTKDLELVRRLFPNIPDAGNPPWAEVEARLVVTGHRKDDLVTLAPPALLALLAGGVFPRGRGILACALVIVLGLLAVIGAWQWGEGDNLLQKIGNCWWLVGLASAAAPFVFRLILGREGWAQVKRKWYS